SLAANSRNPLNLNSAPGPHLRSIHLACRRSSYPVSLTHGGERHNRSLVLECGGGSPRVIRRCRGCGRGGGDECGGERLVAVDGVCGGERVLIGDYAGGDPEDP